MMNSKSAIVCEELLRNDYFNVSLAVIDSHYDRNTYRLKSGLFFSIMILLVAIAATSEKLSIAELDQTSRF